MLQDSFLGQSPLGFHRISYVQWGAAAAVPPVLCVHALTRNGRDFDALAESLASQNRTVFCPDVVGRGRSDRLVDPALYGYPQYLADMTAMLARINTQSIDFVGTSMGGLIGMLMAAQANSPIRRLVINDVGPFLALKGLQRIAGYVALSPRFATMDELEAHVRKIYAPFGDLTDAQWHHLAQHSAWPAPQGGFTLAHDPGIAQNFAALKADVDLWSFYDRINCEVLVLRGEHSDVLGAEVAQEMTQRGPKAKLVTIKNVGHAPALMDAEQIKVIADFLK